MTVDAVIPFATNLEDIDIGEIVYIDNNGTVQLSRGVDYGSDTFSTDDPQLNTSIFTLTDTTFVVVYDKRFDNDLRAVVGTIS
jgi:hypothetical protein